MPYFTRIQRALHCHTFSFLNIAAYIFPVPWYILLYDLHRNTCVLCDLIIFYDTGGCLFPHHSYFFRKSLTLHPETEFTILHKDKKFTIFLAQHLTTSDNPTSLQFWWIYNSNIWLKVENLKYCRKEEKIQNQATRARDSKMPTFSHFYSILIGKNSNKISLIKKSD